MGHRPLLRPVQPGQEGPSEDLADRNPDIRVGAVDGERFDPGVLEDFLGADPDGVVHGRRVGDWRPDVDQQLIVFGRRFGQGIERPVDVHIHVVTGARDRDQPWLPMLTGTPVAASPARLRDSGRGPAVAVAVATRQGSGWLLFG